MVARVDSRGDYVLGTDEEELARLELQNQVWRPHVLECWRDSGAMPEPTERQHIGNQIKTALIFARAAGRVRSSGKLLHPA